MELQGRVHNGVVILDGNPSLPEGAVVTVSYQIIPTVEKKRVQLPLVRSEHPGTLHLTNERIAEILDEEDASP